MDTPSGESAARTQLNRDFDAIASASATNRAEPEAAQSKEQQAQAKERLALVREARVTVRAALLAYSNAIDALRTKQELLNAFALPYDDPFIRWFKDGLDKAISPVLSILDQQVTNAKSKMLDIVGGENPRFSLDAYNKDQLSEKKTLERLRAIAEDTGGESQKDLLSRMGFSESFIDLAFSSLLPPAETLGNDRKRPLSPTGGADSARKRQNTMQHDRPINADENAQQSRDTIGAGHVETNQPNSPLVTRQPGESRVPSENRVGDESEKPPLLPFFTSPHRRHKRRP
ncbi:uncharacterized protein EI97DRAFT_434519 [Westerdykella ornata]|uniref:Uncharacterized protein n=1 Tax=Westerdykella ornata TaxID=318751 RepID=A0A6A6JEG0_WESOR|nr:uncharacterized protein EI97DRAFT_434519 [Westerdykella ornata]KAF2274951.1 hypothetical protein EI97DRAFT_434519 [Westerdykella ornata]